MILPDLNLLLYAYNPHMPQHDTARRWWEGVINGDELIGLPFEVAFGFIHVRHSTPLNGPGKSLKTPPKSAAYSACHCEGIPHTKTRMEMQ